jgi:REP element-mobilizing transposase RayT
MLRGNDGQAIFLEPKDYTIFEQLVAEGVDRFNHQIHGYCWMSNHVHMVVEVADIPLSKIIQNLSFRYTRWINKREKRTGHLFQGRYKAILIEADTYLLELIRYIHLNPVRSNLANTPDDYRWSGHNAYLGAVTCDWLSTDWVLQRFDRKKTDARRAYRQFVMSGLDEEYRKEFHTGNQGGVALANEEFVIRIPEFGKSKRLRNEPMQDLSEISKKVCSFYQVAESLVTASNRSHLASKIRSLVTLLHSEQSGSISRVSEYFEKDVSTLSKNLNKLKQKLLVDSQLQQEVETLKNTKIQA